MQIKPSSPDSQPSGEFIYFFRFFKKPGYKLSKGTALAYIDA